jgi:hypothetical protein
MTGSLVQRMIAVLAIFAYYVPFCLERGLYGMEALGWQGHGMPDIPILERVARAVCLFDCGNPDRQAVAGFQTSVSVGPRGLKEGPFEWENFVPQARAALEAIRELGDPAANAIVAQLAERATKPGRFYVQEAWRGVIDAELS